MTERDHSTPSGPSDEIDVTQALLKGRQTFLGIELLCGPGALVPRPETELLGRVAVEKVRAVGGPALVIDMCCGAGNLACAIATHVPDARVWASDLTDECTEWTRRNVSQLGLASRVGVAQGDLFAGLSGKGLDKAVDVIVCNPPYISSGRLASDRSVLLEHEPREAFDGGPYGVSIHQRVVREAPAFLKPGGWLIVEFGLGQDRQMKLVFERAGSFDAIEFSSNSAGQPRVIGARLKAAQAESGSR
jgi:release factor glutamine methyltransferase